MKNLFTIFLLGFVGAFSFISCMDDDFEVFDPNEQFRLDSIAISNYVKANGIDATRDEKTGIWYEVIESGDQTAYQYKIKDTLGVKRVRFNARVKYIGKLLTGATFDSFQADTGINMLIDTKLTNYYPFDTNIIPAWTYTFLPKELEEYKVNGLFTVGLQKGDKIRIITPSYWGYQNTKREAIPANSPLDFTIEVVDIRDYKTPKPTLN